MDGQANLQLQPGAEVRQAVDKLWELVNSAKKGIGSAYQKYTEIDSANKSLSVKIQEHEASIERLKEDRDLYEQMSIDYEKQIVELTSKQKILEEQSSIYNKDISLLTSKVAENEMLKSKVDELELKTQIIDDLNKKLSNSLEIEIKQKEAIEELRNGTGDYIRLKADYEFAQKEITRRNFQLHENLDRLKTQSERIAELENENYKLKNITTNNYNLEKTNAELEQKLNNAASEKSLLESEIEELRSQVNEIGQLKVDKKSLEETNRIQAATLDDYSSRLLDYKLNKAEYDKLIEELTVQNQRLSAESETQRKENRIASGDNAKLLEMIRQYERKISELHEKNEQAENLLSDTTADLNANLEEAISKFNKLKEDSENLEHENKRLNRLIQEKQGTIAQYIEKMKPISDERNRLLDRIRALEFELLEQSGRKEQFLKQISEFSAAHTQNLDRIAKLGEEISELESKLFSAQQDNEHKKSQIENREQTIAAQESRINESEQRYRIEIDDREEIIKSLKSNQSNLELMLDMKNKKIREIDSQLTDLLKEKKVNDADKQNLINSIERYIQILNNKLHYS
ncbi:MAG: hypothetical protein QG635_1109 [Bacteroidota bacterium]|nr:hypothetical protein [Bacteroidota bacterium]